MGAVACFFAFGMTCLRLHDAQTNKGIGMKKILRSTFPAVLLLAAVLLGTLAAAPAQAHPSTFPDVAESNPAHEAIESLVADEIVAGTLSGAFLPDNPVTRGQTARMITRWKDLQTSSAETHFADVNEETLPYVEAVFEQGWMNGFPDGTFRPYEPLSRQQMVELIVRCLGWEDEALSLTESQIAAALAPFGDEGAISPGARPHLALAVANGVIVGDGDLLNPVSSITRAQFSMVVYRADSLDSGSLVLPAPSADDSVALGTSGAEDGTVDGPFSSVERAQADFMDRYLFQPHDSPITGEMVVQNARWYGIPPLSQLVILAAETSLGDPDLGGALARYYNFGCLRYHGVDTAWGLLSSGRVWVAGRDWYSFPTPQAGMAAFGRYLKAGVDGAYLPILQSAHPDWSRFASIYYGTGVSGIGSYIDRLERLENSFRSKAAEHGVDL